MGRLCNFPGRHSLTFGAATPTGGKPRTRTRHAAPSLPCGRSGGGAAMASDESSATEKPGKQTLRDLGWRKGPDTLERDLEGYWRAFQESPHDDVASYMAFTSVIMVVAAWAEFSKTLPNRDPQWGMPPLDCVPVPWWVLDVITSGWLRYMHAPSGQSLGEAFRLEGGGQGKKRYREIVEKYTRDWKLALDVWHLVQSRRSQGERVSIKDDAIPEVAGRTGLSEDTVRRAWNAHKGLVKSRYDAWGMQNLGK